MCGTTLSSTDRILIPGQKPVANGCQGACSEAKRAACPLAQMMARLEASKAGPEPLVQLTNPPERRKAKPHRYHYARRHRSGRSFMRQSSYRSTSSLRAGRRNIRKVASGQG